MSKELRVYFLGEDEEFDNFTMCQQEVDNWNSYQECHPNASLPQDALDFIERAGLRGNVYTLRGFQNAYNNDELGVGFMFITNNY